MKVYAVHVVIVLTMFKSIKKNIPLKNKTPFKNINSICRTYLNEFCYFMNWYSVTAKYCLLKKFQKCIYLNTEKLIETSQFNRDSPNSVANMNTIKFLKKYDKNTQLMYNNIQAQF